MAFLFTKEPDIITTIPDLVTGHACAYKNNPEAMAGELKKHYSPYVI